MKLSLFLLFFTTWGMSAQQKNIVDILNKGLKKEMRNQTKSRDFDGDTTTVVQPFTINDKNILSLRIREYNTGMGKYQIILQEVSLDSVYSVDKDINVLFRTKEEAVNVTVFNEGDDSTEGTTSKGHLFFTHIRTLKKDEALGNAIQKAFKKAGFIINKEYWAD